VNSTQVSKLWPIGRHLEFDGSATPVKTTLFLIVCIAWLLPGLVGHDPWKSEEAVTFGLTHHILTTGDWVVPTAAGQAYAATPPLYPMVAALSAKLFSGLLPLHDGARLATGLFIGLAIYCLALTANQLFGARFGRLGALLLIGSLGLLLRAHEMSPDVAVLGALAFGIYALTQLREHSRLGALLFGTALGASFMAGGLGPALMLLLALLVLCAIAREWRPEGAWASALVAALAAAPWFIAWPSALWQAAPDVAAQFWHGQFAALGGIFGAEGDAFYFVRTLAWCAWPSLPIILARLWYERGRMLRQSELRMPLVVFAVFLVGLSMTNDTRDGAALPLLLPLALIAAASVDSLRRGMASALDWFGMMTFGLFTALIWLAWLAGQTGWPARVARELVRLAPGVQIEFGFGKMLFAALLTLLWIAIIAHARRSNRRAIVNWTAGITAFWILLMTLWLPVIDQARSYRATMLSLRSALASQYTCVSGHGFTLSQRALFEYLIDLRIKPVESVAEAHCNHLLVMGVRSHPPKLDSAWREIWQGARPNDGRQVLRLYQHSGA
jgi:4-amino-4-deoxy-L-arabinose transferase-like glycosyltransferase